MLGADRTGEIRRARFREGRPTEGTCRDPGVSRARPAGRIRHRESACNRIVRNRLKGAGRHWSKVDANALLAIGCCFENMRVPDFLEWRACRAAGAQPKKMDRTRKRLADGQTADARRFPKKCRRRHAEKFGPQECANDLVSSGYAAVQTKWQSHNPGMNSTRGIASHETRKRIVNPGQGFH